MEKSELKKHTLPASFSVDGKTITNCQARIISLNAQGLQRKNIAHLLGNSKHTVDSHFDRIYKLLQINDSRQLVAWALANGFDAQGCLNGLYLFDEIEEDLPWSNGPVDQELA